MNYVSGAFVGLGLCHEIIIFRRMRRDRQYVFESCNNSITCYGVVINTCIFPCFYLSAVAFTPVYTSSPMQFSLLRLLSFPCPHCPCVPPSPRAPWAPQLSWCGFLPPLGLSPSLLEDLPFGKGMGLVSCWCYLINKTKPVSQQQTELPTQPHCSTRVSSTAPSPECPPRAVHPKIGFLDADGLLKSLQKQTAACTG